MSGWDAPKERERLDVFRPEIEALLANGSTQQFIAHRYGTTKQNLANWLKKHHLQRGRT